jgi:DNA polymerase-3 subunit epsilon
MREIVLDTETTGLDPLRGDRLVEIGCLEIYNRMPTGQTFHVYINPERDMPAEAFAVHGLSTEFLASKPLFHEVVEDFLAFVADAPLVIHNASFDISFINAELERIKRPAIARERLVDTLLLARRKHPGVSNRLDDLCSRYAIDNSRRTKHGALLDAELLAEVYIDLIGARQSQLILASETRIIQTGGYGEMPRRQREVGDKPIWSEYLPAA